MPRTLKRVAARNRYLRHRRERLPTIRSVETTTDDIDRRMLSPVNSYSSPSISAMKSYNESNGRDADYNVFHRYDCENENSSEVYYNNDDNNRDYNDEEISATENDDVAQTLDDSNIIRRPDSLSWAIQCEELVEEAEKEYENSLFVSDDNEIAANSGKKYSRMISIGQLGKFYSKNHSNSYRK